MAIINFNGEQVLRTAIYETGLSMEQELKNAIARGQDPNDLLYKLPLPPGLLKFAEEIGVKIPGSLEPYINTQRFPRHNK